MRRAVRATRTAISPRLAIRTQENMGAEPVGAFPGAVVAVRRGKCDRIGDRSCASGSPRSGCARDVGERGGAWRGCAVRRPRYGVGPGAICCGAAGGDLAAGRHEAACWGRRGGVGAFVVADFVSGLVSAGMPGSGFMILTGGIDPADGKSYFGDSGVATGPGAGGVEAVV